MIVDGTASLKRRNVSINRRTLNVACDIFTAPLLLLDGPERFADAVDSDREDEGN